MSNGIKIRQNEEKSITMLAAQRQLYSDAKKYNCLSIIFAVLIPFAMSFILLFVPESSPICVASYIASIISAVISYFVDGIVSNKKELAAAIQQIFDTYVYSMPWDSRIFGQEKTLSDEIATCSKKIICNPVKKDALYDWYPPEINEKPLLDGILLCQRENVWWDVGLRKRFKHASEAFIVVLCISVFIIGICRDENVVRLLWRLAFVAPMIEWLLGTIKSLNEDIRSLVELDDFVRPTRTRTMEELQDIQKMIFEHRKKCFSIPNLFYSVFKNNDEDKAHRTASMDI